MSKKMGVVWGLFAIFSVLATALIFLPASWLAFLLEKQTSGRLSLGDVQGSFWRGSAFKIGRAHV